jgi:benzoyl-CoA reductase/2-hydroxyglutaryl-CoA dehydratase subunit BcrC/BadD/HgdB
MPAKRVEIRASGALRQVMALHFEEIRQAAEEGKGNVAWCTSVGPAELLHAMGFRVYFPENHGAMLGTSRASADLIPAAVAAGYSPEICSYLTSDVGGYLKGETPLKKLYGFKGIPRPDVLVYNTNQCRDVQDWFSFYQREFNVPLVGVSTPHPVPELEERHIKGVESQMEALVEPLEKVAGSRLDKDAMRKAVRLSRECSDLWKEVLRVLKPGGHLAAFGATRSYHRMAVAIEDAQGKLVRHVVYGVLGANAPEPFQRNSLGQTVAWDGKNDKYMRIPAESELKLTPNAAYVHITSN